MNSRWPHRRCCLEVDNDEDLEVAGKLSNLRWPWSALKLTTRTQEEEGALAGIEDTKATNHGAT
jgi:hypothetical protein